MNQRSGVWTLLLADVVVPIAGYYLLHACGVGDVAALACGAALSSSRVVIAAVRTWITPASLEALEPGRMQGHGGAEEISR